MLKSDVKCENFDKNNILYRASLRGLKKCTSCGYINGQRALICRNVSCDLRIRRLAAIKPFDPIQLVTYGRTKLYSLRSKEKLLQPRNFVSVTEAVTAFESHCPYPTAVCYVGNCKYDAHDRAHLVCRHIKACKVLSNVAQAEIYPIDKSVLWNLNITHEQKQHLWNLYRIEEHIIHPIQKLNSSIFVVKCEESKMFPAGRLHVTVFSDVVPNNKGGNFSCSCKKLKIILEPDNSVTMKQEICDHLLLLLAAILNRPEGKSLYRRFLDTLQYLWMPTSLNTPLAESAESRSNQFLKNENSLDTHTADDIFNFTEELFAENNLPDFSDIILDIKEEKNPSSKGVITKASKMLNMELNLKDPKLNTIGCSIKDEDLDFPTVKSPEPLISPITTVCNTIQTAMNFNESDLSVIEQFQLNHHMQISSDNIELAKDIENLNNMESEVFQIAAQTMENKCQQKSLLKTNIMPSNSTNSLNKNTIEEFKPKPCVVVKSSNIPLNTDTVQKSVVLKQRPVKIIKIATPMPAGSIQKLSTDNKRIIQMTKINPNKIIVLKPNSITSHQNKQQQQLKEAIKAEETVQYNNSNEINNIMPSLTYDAWLDHIIEILNDSISIENSSNIRNTFHVAEEVFNHFSKSFTFNNKPRMPNISTVIKNGKYKGHIKYVWFFKQPTMVQRIFSSKNLKIELERLYQRLNDDTFELYKPEYIGLSENDNFRPIYPKLQLYKVLLQFPNTSEEIPTNNQMSQKYGLKLEWLPSAFPKSNFGLMTIEFCVSVKEPDSL